MSYTLKMEINVCSGTMYELSDIGNYSEGCEPLFDEAFPLLTPIETYNGVGAWLCEAVFTDARDDMVEREEHYRGIADAFYEPALTCLNTAVTAIGNYCAATMMVDKSH
jgi:hypothetical protein